MGSSITKSDLDDLEKAFSKSKLKYQNIYNKTIIGFFIFLVFMYLFYYIL